MHLTSVITWAAALVGTVSADGAATYRDPETGFIFSEWSAQYQLNASPLFFRIAQPSGASAGFEVVLQIVAPINVQWAAVSWGGSMTNSPLSVIWPNGNNVTVSSRYTAQRVKPNVWTGATHQVLKIGTGRNGTHWRAAVKCTGCTQWSARTLNPQGSHRLAWAWADERPTNPASSASDFPYHDSHGYWQHDFNPGANPQYAQLLQKNA